MGRKRPEDEVVCFWGTVVGLEGDVLVGKVWHKGMVLGVLGEKAERGELAVLVGDEGRMEIKPYRPGEFPEMEDYPVMPLKEFLERAGANVREEALELTGIAGRKHLFKEEEAVRQRGGDPAFRIPKPSASFALRRAPGECERKRG